MRTRGTASRGRSITFWRKQLLSWYRAWQWAVIGGLWCLALCLGCAGFARYFAVRAEAHSAWDILYLSLQLIPLQSGAVPPPVPWELEVGRLLAPAVSAYAAAVAVAAIFYERWQLLRLRFICGHVVICGLGRKGLLLARGFLERGFRVVVIDLNEDSSLLEEAKAAGATILTGDATNQELLLRARVHKARYLISVGGDDGMNAEVAIRACALLANRQESMLTCFIHIVDSRLCSLLRERELAMEQAGPFKLEFFNIFDSGAQALLEEYPPFAMDAEITSQPHLLLVGLGRMGENVVLHAARAWKIHTRDGRLHITIIDRQAERRTEALRLQYPWLDALCELVPREIDVRWPEFEQATFLYDGQGRCAVTAVYVCLDNDSLNLSTGLSLLQHLREHQVPIVVRMTDEAGLAMLLHGREGASGYDSLRPFGLLEHTCRPEALFAQDQANSCYPGVLPVQP